MAGHPAAAQRGSARRLLLVFAAVFMLLLAAGTVVQAAPNRVTFNDGSRKYLQYTKNTWVLRDKNGKYLTGLQYLAIRDAKNLTAGYYVFDSQGRLIQKRTVYKFSKRTVHGVVFEGYYYAAAKNGRICYTASGLVPLKNIKCSGTTFDGIYYVDKMGKIDTPYFKVRYLNKATIGGTTVPAGYYLFNTLGRLCRYAQFKTINNQKAGNITFNGQYYFMSGGALCTKEGIITYNGKKYYVTKEGKKLTSTWKNGYYFQADGSMAISTRVPDGSYVGSDGRKISQGEMSLSGLKSSLNSMISGFSGTWSVYVKNLKTDDWLSINDVQMYPASTIKAFAMAFAFGYVNRNKFSYDDNLKTLMTYMITESDNNSFNTIVTMAGGGNFLTGAKLLNDYLRQNGYTKTALHHIATPVNIDFITDGGTNAGSAKDCGLLLERIYKGTCVNSTYSQMMMNLLLGQKRRWKIPAALPANAIVANKTGETDKVQHDIAIVSGPKTDYVICVYSTASETAGIAGNKAISQAVWNYLEG